MIAAVSGISLIRGFLNPAIDSLKMTAAGRTLERFRGSEMLPEVQWMLH
mgnify:CR=1 FL=1